MRDGFEMEEKMRKLTESNASLKEKLEITEKNFSEHKCNSSCKIEEMKKVFTKQIKDMKNFADIE
jgi:hypothetical protein